MTTRTALTWLLGGAAFVLGIAGCASYDGALRATSAKREAADQSGFAQHTFVDNGYDADICVDPKGQWLVFTSTRHSAHANIWLQKADGLSVMQLTSGDADNALPTFSPDGKTIAFCSKRDGDWNIYQMNRDGINVVQITSGPMQKLHPSFSPDGKRLVYSARSNRNGQWELWIVNLASGEMKMIGNGVFPCWSPAKDHDQIAFQKTPQNNSQSFSLWTLELADGTARHVTEVAVSSNAAIVSPCWNPDGSKLSFATIASPRGQQDVWTINADGTNRHRITDGVGNNASPCWGSDNKIYFISNRGGAECVWSASAGTSPTATAGLDTSELMH